MDRMSKKERKEFKDLEKSLKSVEIAVLKFQKMGWLTMYSNDAEDFVRESYRIRTLIHLGLHRE